MAPPTRESESESESEDDPGTPPQAYEQPQPQAQPETEHEPIIEQLAPFAIYEIYRCPLFWCPVVKCGWYGPNYQLYHHFAPEAQNHGDNATDVKEINAPTLCEWPNYIHACDTGGEENGLYRLLMRTHGNLIFFLSAKANNDGSTGIHVIYIGRENRANRYTCKISIQNRGDEAAAPINLTLVCGATTGLNDIVAIDQQVGVVLQNEDLKGYCAENGSLYFLVELEIPEDEREEQAIRIEFSGNGNIVV